MLQPTIVKERVRALPEEDETAPIVGLPRGEKTSVVGTRSSRQGPGGSCKIEGEAKICGTHLAAGVRYMSRVYSIALGGVQSIIIGIGLMEQDDDLRRDKVRRDEDLLFEEASIMYRNEESTSRT
jgi:hypothetical protein